MICTNCGSENEPGRKFCGECGASLSIQCPNCGSPNGPGVKFCGECGHALGTEAFAAAPTPVAAPVAERRLVSVLFADLVGFTTLSESRDPEEVRELLSQYFDTSRQLIARYGGTVEKFIGDAVMAVWGAPTAKEDDAERAVRAALELTAAVEALGEEAGAPDLKARAGVLTGEAAVTLGAEGQGMVAGDLVNTASRIQSAATPGSVYVGEATKRASEAAIAYEDAGSHTLKGKAEPVELWRAVRVVGLRGGLMTSSALEPPFVGRDRELRLVKERYHAVADEGRASLVSVVGVGGIGKSRLTWEFEKYFDGLADDAWWHRGRCLAYGDGVAFWALAEMVRSRAGIVEDEDSASASAKLRATIDALVPDAGERRFIEPRLAQLLSLEDRGPGDQANLFSAWRLFFERMSDTDPVILVFEDIHWADDALLDFIEHLLEWSRDKSIFLLTLARPELLDRRPTWGAGKRGFTSIFLEPLPPEAMQTLLSGPLPGLPDDVLAKLLDRAEGVPFYAVETVRMLLDRGLVVRDGNAYRATGPIETLEVPETLQALIAARLDGLDLPERRLIQDAAVVGKTFTKASLSAITELSETEIEPLLASLLRKELVTIQADPRSPERGQYGFLQDLVRRVAYDTLSRKDRKARHLAAAAYLETVWGPEEEEVVEVVASHYLEAYQAAPDAPDAAEIKVKALDALVNAGRRAASLAAGLEARRYFERAIELADDPLRRAELHEQAGRMAQLAVHFDEAEAHYEKAIELYTSAGKTHPAARASAMYSRVIRNLGRGEEAIEHMEAALSVLEQEEPDEDLARLSAELARTLYFVGRFDEANEHVERALTIAELHQLPEVFSEALNTRSLVLLTKGRSDEALILVRHALKVALDNDLTDSALRSYNNIGAFMNEMDRHDEEAEITVQVVELARRVGNRFWERQGLAGAINASIYLGRWDEALSVLDELKESMIAESETRTTLVEIATLPFVHVSRGDLEAAGRALAAIAALRDSSDPQERASYSFGEGWVLFGEEKFTDALAAALRSYEDSSTLGPRLAAAKEALGLVLEAAFAAGDLEVVERHLVALESRRRGQLSPYLVALTARFRARLAAARGESDVEPGFRKAVEGFRGISTPFWVAVTLLEHGEWLAAQGREQDAKPVLDEAAGIFTTLGARPWLERLERVLHVDRAATGS